MRSVAHTTSSEKPTLDAHPSASHALHPVGDAQLGLFVCLRRLFADGVAIIPLTHSFAGNACRPLLTKH